MRRRRTYATIAFEEPGFPFHIQTVSSDPGSNSLYASHAHAEAVELQYVQYGNGTSMIGSRFCDMRPRTLSIIPPRTAHGYTKEESSRLDRTTLILKPQLFHDRPSGLLMDAWIRTLPRPACLHVQFDADHAAQFEQVLTRLRQEWSHKGRHYHEAVLACLDLLAITIQQAWHTQPSRAAADSDTRLMHKLLAIIESSFRQALTLHHLAAAVGRSPCHVSHLFTRMLKLNFKSYLAARRIVEARRLLDSDSMVKMFAVAMESGFTSLSAFHRTFRRQVGLSPNRYRSLNRPADAGPSAEVVQSSPPPRHGHRKKRLNMRKKRLH